MGSALQIKFKDTLYPDMSFIDLKVLEVDGDKIYNFDLINKSGFDIEDIKFTTNMKPEHYSIEHSKNMSKETKSAPVKLTIHTLILFESKDIDLFDTREQKHILQMQFDYNRVRKFS